MEKSHKKSHSEKSRKRLLNTTFFIVGIILIIVSIVLATSKTATFENETYIYDPVNTNYMDNHFQNAGVYIMGDPVFILFFSALLIVFGFYLVVFSIGSLLKHSSYYKPKNANIIKNNV